MYSEEDLIPISALQHYAFCPRQCALIHVEQLWAENSLTMEGRIMHERVHDSETENRPGLRMARGLRIHSFRLGLVGQADVVEFHRHDSGVILPDAEGKWRPFPVEFKRGKPKIDGCDEVQLCAQVACLEEMLNCTIPDGALFYGKPRRRHDVEFTQSLRDVTEDIIRAVRVLFDARITPTAPYNKKCDSCSMYNFCIPKTTGSKKSAKDYVAKAFEDKL
jgi:CRISPR-associated exonuclease Cas4